MDWPVTEKTKTALLEMIDCAVRELRKSELEHIDDLLRHKVVDPDPLTPFMDGLHMARMTTYGLVGALLRERNLFREKLNDLLNDCINFDDGNLTEVIQSDASQVLKKHKVIR